MYELFKEGRKQKNMSLRALAEKTGISHSHLRDIENGKYRASMENSIMIAEALGLDKREVLIQSCQAALRENLSEMVKMCHNHQIKLPFDVWEKSGLPILHSGIEDLITGAARIADTLDVMSV